MSNKRQDKIMISTFGVVVLLLLGSMICDFKIYDVVYIVGIIIYIIRYKLQKDM